MLANVPAIYKKVACRELQEGNVLSAWFTNYRLTADQFTGRSQ